jgi:hypothetical protein
MHLPRLIGLSLLALATTFSAQATTLDPAATKEIQTVVDTFQAAIIAKDGKRLENLFLPTGGAWFMVLSDNAYAHMKAKSATVPRFKQGNHVDFVKFVATAEKPIQEKFSNVRIDTDGAVASVYFDFVFLFDGKEENRGSEAWHLLKSDQGWKINSMTYSVNPPER